ncbi:Sec-independent protein translocase protein TatB [Thalassobius sp. Cn5-15]|uniref:Sec-independent protein translocase protein TatB n=1 Tax=Thalassobius sp. Cn5-15 TaxID=2917763 RepID=UPI001EF37C7C|nr:Sec-independent protein translocase protein TatB [Thalassobius sp. Cn5-15]MCG7494776.1 Sec-independent protein translocase protein TatB [Thalassobius sp. Cn5-15]
MFDLGMSELLIIGVVALIVVGPKDLPGLFRSVGQFVGKARGMAREFSRAMEQAADESGVKDISQTLKAASNPKQFGMDKVREATDGLTDWSATDTPLSDDRAEAARKIQEATAAKEQARRDAEEAAAAAEEVAPEATAAEEPKDKG